MLPNAGMDCITRETPGRARGNLPGAVEISPDQEHPGGSGRHLLRARASYSVLCGKNVSINSNDPVLLIDEVVRNESDEDMDFMWGHHPALGWPFLDESCRIYLPACRVRTSRGLRSSQVAVLKKDKILNCRWSKGAGAKPSTCHGSSAPPEVRSHDMAYLYDLEDGWYALVNSSRGVGFGLRWDKTLFPHLWFWQLYRGGMGYPWFGANYTAAQVLVPFPTLRR